MRRLVIATMLVLGGCSLLLDTDKFDLVEPDTNEGGDTDTDTDSDTGTDSDTDGDTDSDSDGDIDADSDGDTDIDMDSDTDGDTDGDSDGDTDGDSDGDTDTDGDGDSDNDTNTDPGSGVCEDPFVIQKFPFWDDNSNSGYSNELNINLCSQEVNGAGEVIYRFSATQGYRYDIVLASDLKESANLSIADSCNESATCLASTDEAGTASYIATANDSYYLVVDAANGTHTYTLFVEEIILCDGVFCEPIDCKAARCESELGCVYDDVEYPDIDDNTCDYLDNNCDGRTDEGANFTTYYVDNDGDGYAASTSGATDYCTSPVAGWTQTEPAGISSTDCNDTGSGASIHPGASDNTCDSTDNDCDTLTDEDATWLTYYVDGDGDGYAPNTTGATGFCSDPGLGWTLIYPTGSNVDCYDGSAERAPNVDSWSATAIGGSYDRNCDDEEEERWTMLGSCSMVAEPVIHCEVASEGWNGDIPECGDPGDYVTSCGYSPVPTPKCTKTTEEREQECR